MIDAARINSADQLRQVVRSVRRQWRWRLMLRGVSVFVPATLVCVIVATLGMDRLRFQPSAVLAFSLAVYVAIAAFCLWFLARPLRRRVTDEQVSLYIEEHEPGLAGELVTAVEFAERQGEEVSPDLVRRLIQGAVARASGLDPARVERSSVARSGGVLAGTSVAMLALALINPSFLRNGLSYLFAPIMRHVAANPYSIDVTPGDTLVPRGADVRINANLRNFGAERVEVVLRHSQDAPWERWPMAVDAASGKQTLLLFKVQQASEYYVEATGVRSRTFHVAVADLPYTKQIDLEYHYPAYTGLPDDRQENTGDIAAMAGTVVTVQVTPTIAVSAGVLVLSGTDTVRLTADGTRLNGKITVQKPGAYRVALQANNGMLVGGSADYTIDVLADRKPVVRFTKPGRDTRASPIDEVFTEATAQDDYGVSQMEFVYSVNGGPQKVERLYSAGSTGLKRVTAGHTFYLEELHLKPGDFISYFARAADARGATGTGASDIYFLEIRPFDRSFKQGDQQGGGNGGDQNPGETVGELSRRQRDVVAGTFRMVRDSASYADKDYRENLATLALSQGRLREDVKQLADRMKSRGVVALDSTLAVVLAQLPPAIDAMTKAEEQLGQRKAPTAMPPEQEALQYLQKAEEAFREREITRQQGQQGRASQRASTDELSELFDLELDRQRNQYEQVQRGQQQQADQQVDETLERLRQLAERQQAENERMRTQGAQQGSPQAGGGGGQGQRAIADSVADLAHQLEKLSREQQNDQLAETARQLRQAADQMRRAAANGAQGTSQGNAALDRLQEARRLLEQNRSGGLKRDVQDALNRAEHLAQEEQGISSQVNRLADSSADTTGRSGRALGVANQKADMANQVKDLVNDLDRMARESRSQQPDASSKLKDAAQNARQGRLEDLINYSRGVVQGSSPEYAQSFEQQIGAGVGQLRDRVKDALGSIGESRDQRLQQNLDRARDIANGLESVADRAQQQQGRQPASQSAGQPDQRGQPGNTGAASDPQSKNGQAGRPADRQTQSSGQSGQQGQQGNGQQAGDQRGQGNGGPGGGLGERRLQDQQNRQLQDDMRQQTSQLRQLRDQMRKDGVDVGQLNSMLDALGRMDNKGPIGNPRDIAQLKQNVVQGLKDWEFNLRRQLAGGNPALFGSGSEDVSPEYRKMVEQYYKSLAQQKK